MDEVAAASAVLDRITLGSGGIEREGRGGREGVGVRGCVEGGVRGCV